MRTVWKYAVPVDGAVHQLLLPMYSTVVHVGHQDDPGEIVFWATVDTANVDITRRFTVVGTGHSISPSLDARYIGTTQAPFGLVWHLFETEAPF